MAVNAPPRVAGACLLALGCASQPIEEQGDDETQAPADPVVVATAIGAGDGSPSSVTLTKVYVPAVQREATALAFNPLAEDELWVTLREPDSALELTCTETVTTGCEAMVGKIAIISGASAASPSAVVEVDDNSWHFLRIPSSIAFAPSGAFATCGDSWTANYTDDPFPYTGPVLWDPALFGERAGPEQNGLHLDMLHETPFCMGIAHQVDNVYWTFNGDIGAIDRYDFKSPHPPGGEDHSDGELLRYVEGALARVPRVPSHMDYDEKSGWLYVADSGHGRVVRLDTASGTPGADITAYDPILVHSAMDNAVLEEMIAPGLLERPSGLVLHRGVLFVTDNASGMIHAFNGEGEELRRLDTGLAPGVLGGVAIGAGGHAFFTNLINAEVTRIDPL
jgi:DNA-binding beta-propeller fold protein YncE